MSRTPRPRTLTIALVGLAAATTLQAAVETPAQFTERISSELRAKNPAAAESFDKANRARDAEQWAEAERHYKEVLRLELGYVHATRRLCSVVLQQGRRSEAQGLCRQAFASEKTPENRAALIGTLLPGGPKGEATAAEKQEAKSQAVVLIAGPELDPVLLYPACQAAVAAEDLVLLRSCGSRLASAAPREAPTHYFAWIVAMADGDFDAASAALERARQYGLSPQAYAEFKKVMDEARPRWPRLLAIAGAVVAAWLLGLVALFGVGLSLSRAALRAARELPAVQTGESLGMARSLRRIYQVVLAIASFYYYTSIPIVLAIVVVAGGALIYGFFAIGHVPIKLVALVAIVVLVTLWAALKSLLVRVKDEDPGDRLDTAKHPRLRTVLDEVAAQIGTRPVDNVYMTPGTDLAVTERGGMMRQLRGSSERCLILGVGVLDGLRLGPFKAILAHEYGHFSNRDTAGGGLALAVRRSLLTMAHSLAESGAAAWYNPAWLFLNGFNLIFLRISQGASRLQETLADRWAVFAYGAKAFEQGLRHVVEQSVRFDAHANSTIQEVVDGKLALSNLYSFKPSKLPSETEILKAVADAIDAKPSPYDSHPAPADRFRLVHALPARQAVDPADAGREAWELFEDPAGIQAWMTDRICAAVAANHGVTINRGV
jgi:Zn-dependent protease with chaperone function